MRFADFGTFLKASGPRSTETASSFFDNFSRDTLFLTALIFFPMPGSASDGYPRATMCVAGGGNFFGKAGAMGFWPREGRHRLGFCEGSDRVRWRNKTQGKAFDGFRVRYRDVDFV